MMKVPTVVIVCISGPCRGIVRHCKTAEKIVDVHGHTYVKGETRSNGEIEYTYRKDK